MLLELFACLLAVATVGAHAVPANVAPRPDSGAVIAGQYIVVFKPEAGPAPAAAAALSSHVRSQLAAASAASAASAATMQPVEVLHTLGGLAAHQGTSNAANSAVTAAGLRPGAAQAAAKSGMQGVVMRLSHPAALAAVQSASTVAAVIPDRVVASQQQAPTCVDPQQLSLGLSTTQVSKTFVWRSCNTARTELRWIGERCGPNMDQISYTAVYAVIKGSNLIARVAGEDCILTLNATATTSWNRLRFGGCGTPPLYATLLPTCIAPAPTAVATGLGDSSSSSSSGSGSCVSAADATAASGAGGGLRFNMSATLSTAVRCGSRNVRSVMYVGTPCGPDKQFVAWFKAAGPGGCSLVWRTGQVKYNNDLFGSCGVPLGIKPAGQQALPTTMCPQAAVVASPSPAPVETYPSPSPEPSPSPLPSPTPSPAPVDVTTSPSPSPSPADTPSSSPTPSSPDVSSSSPQPSPSSPDVPSSPPQSVLLPRSAVLAGDEAPTGVQRIEAATTDGVVNTAGLPVDRQVVVGVMDSGVDGTHPDINYAGGLSWVSNSPADVDGYGHGTHVAGIVAARNNGAGVVGVAPGIPVYSLKVLDNEGRGMLSTVMSAMKWVASVGAAQGVRVINISLSAFIDPASPDYTRTADLVCSVFAEAAQAGVVVVIAAGNYGSGINSYFPSACPTVAAVTAIDADGIAPAGFSNFMPVNSPPADLARVIAAPGSYVKSTVPIVVDGSGYAYMTGTSMAAPHVAGVAANCVMSGACASGSGMDKLAVLQAAAKQRYTVSSQKPYGFTGDAYSTASEQYYGLLVWSAAF